MTSLMNQMDRDRMKLSNYQSAIIRIANARTVGEVAKVEKGLDRVYDAGQLTTSELSRLSDLAMRRTIELEEDFEDILVDAPENPALYQQYYSIVANYNTPEEFENWNEGANEYTRDAAYKGVTLEYNDGDGGSTRVVMGTNEDEPTSTIVQGDCNYVEPDIEMYIGALTELKEHHNRLLKLRDAALAG